MRIELQVLLWNVNLLDSFTIFHVFILKCILANSIAYTSLLCGEHLLLTYLVLRFIRSSAHLYLICLASDRFHIPPQFRGYLASGILLSRAP